MCWCRTIDLHGPRREPSRVVIMPTSINRVSKHSSSSAPRHVSMPMRREGPWRGSHSPLLIIGGLITIHSKIYSLLVIALIRSGKMCPLVPPSGVLVSPFVYFSLFQSDTQTPFWPAAIIFYFKQCMVVMLKENAIPLNVWGPLIIGRGSSLAPIDIKLRLLIYHLIDYQSTLRRFVTGPILPI